MVRVRARGEEIRRFILERVTKYPADVSSITAEHFNITRQAVNKHLHRLVDEGVLSVEGKTRNRSYKLAAVVSCQAEYGLAGLQEDVVWRDAIIPMLGHQPQNVLDIWQYGLTEIINNAVDHSGGTTVHLHIAKTAIDTSIALSDNGIGIFKKIQMAMNLLDERHAILELSKGKLTTDPAHHTGEGLFFTSRMFDSFDILSGGVYYTHQFGDTEDWILERSKFESGTTVWMKLNNHTARTTRKIFDQYASPDGDYAFNKTVVPVRLAQYGNDKLVSRSQAKRLLGRVELFKTVIFDFDKVDSIGQAFADEIFRVFANTHPEILLMTHKANSEVKRMITRVKAVEEEDLSLEVSDV